MQWIKFKLVLQKTISLTHLHVVDLKYGDCAHLTDYTRGLRRAQCSIRTELIYYGT